MLLFKSIFEVFYGRFVYGMHMLIDKIVIVHLM